MVDRTTRDQFAEHLRHFAAGVLSVDEYEARTMELVYASEDKAPEAVWEFAWALYDDFRTDRLRDGWTLPPENRAMVARALLFLYGDTQYQWPDATLSGFGSYGSVGCFFNLLSFGMWNRVMEPRREQYLRQFGELECWPFLNQGELNRARQAPKCYRAGERDGFATCYKFRELRFPLPIPGRVNSGERSPQE